ncbi:MAG: protein kinase [Planctomycetota bacterium]
MDAERYARVRELFLAADELPEEERDSYLAAQCEGDPALLEEIRSLLGEHDEHSARIEGESAKQPVIPASPNSSSDSTQTGVVEQHVASSSDTAVSDRKETSEKATSPVSRAPFLPGNRDGSGPARDESKRRSADEFQRRRDPATKRGAAKKKSSQETQQLAQRTHASPRYADESDQVEKPKSTSVFEQRKKRNGPIHASWLWIAAIVPTVLFGYWTYVVVDQKLREATKAELASVAGSVQASVDRFLSDQARLVNSWGRQVGLREAVIGLLELGPKATPAQLDSSEHANSIRHQLIAVSSRENIKYVIWDRTGRIIASWLPDGSDLGGYVSPQGTGNLARAIEGETVLFGPEILEQDQSSGFVPETRRPVMAEIIPIKDRSGDVIATMLVRGFGMFEAFDEIFRTASVDGGLDVYAVNRLGYMINNSGAAVSLMFDDEASGTDSTPNDTFVACRLRVSDPKESIASRSLSPQIRRTQQLTYAAAGATLAMPGVRLEPYPNYAGRPVVGAWRSVGQHGVGIIVERPASSAFAATRFIRFGFIGLGAWLSLTAIWAAIGISKRTELARAAVHPLSRYQLVAELGSGGMGVVYRAKHKQLGRDSALKVLRGDRDNVEDRLRFDREAKLAASLSSPHTVTIYDYGRGESDEAYCVMEFLKGITLYDAVARSGFQKTGRVLYILRQICDSLGEAHALGLVHRDVKPQNIMLSHDASVGDWAVVFDFGLAKPLEPDGESFQTADTVWAGTPMYMAPERYRQPNEIDPRSDIYSVGCVAYFLLSGRPPFIECDPESLFALVLTEKPISIEVHRDEEIPDEIQQLVQRCMAKSVEDRFSTIDQLANELDRLIPHYPWTAKDAKDWWRIHGDDA